MNSKKILLSILTASFITAVVFLYNNLETETPEPAGKATKGYPVSKEHIENNLRKSVQTLASGIGSRGFDQQSALLRSIEFISSSFESYGYDVHYQSYRVRDREYQNVWVKKQGALQNAPILVVGAHYDTVTGTPGADDNASGVSGLLELARLLSVEPVDMDVHFVAFTLEEPPYFRTRSMGSFVYAQELKQADVNVEGMICLESIGYFDDTPGSQMFPLPFLRFKYPDRGNFITFVSDLGSKGFLKNLIVPFMHAADLKAESFSAPSVVPGVDLSDHRSFWKFGYKAVMITDTAFYRNPNYHGRGDSADSLDYSRMTEVIIGLRAAVLAVAMAQSKGT